VIKIGLVDLDTPRVKAYADLLRGHADLSIAAVWDGHSVYPPGYARCFAAENEIPHVCESLEEMAELVDLALILGVDWDFHLMRAEPFVKAAKMVYIDSPTAGKAAHCTRLLDWEDEGARIMAGGPGRFSKEGAGAKNDLSNIGEIASVIAGAPPDFFSRGVHALGIVSELLGPGATSVKFIGSKGETKLFLLDYDGGPVVIAQLASPGHEFCLNMCGEKRKAMLSLDLVNYAPFVEKLATFARTGEPPVRLKHALEPVRLLIAAHCAAGHRDPVYIHNLDRCAGFDGWGYADEYAAAAKSMM
jgi:virulence factor